jgi:alpha-N-arabinofuranosidase
MKISRRQFVGRTALGAAAVLLPLRLTAATQGTIEVLVNEPIGTIAPEVYGHFTEHIGGVIYDGIWVGEKSKVPNQYGIRTALVEHMKRIRPTVVRWPGGCFADSYNWRDGVGPRAKRPTRTNFWINDPWMQSAPDGPEKYEPNQFGTPEFMRFCKLIGAQPYLATNVRSNTARDFDEWVDYCNAPTGKTTLAKEREADGSAAPYRVRYWGVGNESWGCGGNFAPEEYATEFRRFTAWVPNYGQRLSFIGAGPNGGDLNWTRKFFEHCRGQLNDLYGWALHYYCGTAGRGDAIDFTVNDWYELLRKAAHMERIITDQWAAMGEIDKQHRVKLIVDEWGSWHHAGTEVKRTHLFGQTSTMRDALVAALTLDIFNRNAEKIAMANVAQLINNLHSLFLAREDKFVATPNFDVFEMYAAHQGGKSVRTMFDVASSGSGGLPLLSGSASLRGKQLVLTVVNTHDSEAQAAGIRLRNGAVKSVAGRVLRADDIHAHNSFAEPNAVRARDVEVAPSNGAVVHTFPAASVSRLVFELS